MTHQALPLITHSDELLALTEPHPKACACSCSLKTATGWSSVSETDWPKHLNAVACLQDPQVFEPSFEEYHPNGTRYDAPLAPIALGFFPTHRCTVYACTQCHQYALRYTEFGGYYVDPRARLLNPQLVVGEDLLRPTKGQ